MTPPIRVVVANRPRLMREMVLEAISEQPDIEILAEIQDPSDISRIVDEMHPDFLIISLDDSDERPAICDQLLVRFPEMKILALAPERNSCMFFWASFRIHSNPIESSEMGILNTLRSKGLYA